MKAAAGLNPILSHHEIKSKLNVRVFEAYIRTQEFERSMFVVTAGLVNEDGELGVFGENLVAREKGDSRGQDGGLDDRVLGTIEAEEITHSPGCDGLRLDHHAVLMVVERRDA